MLVDDAKHKQAINHCKHKRIVTVCVFIITYHKSSNMCGASDKNNKKASSSCTTSFSSSYSSSTDGLTYHHGFANHLESEAYPGALPQGRNNPRLVPHGLYTEQISGTAFTAPRNENRRTWLYRAQPSVSGTSNPFYACGGNSSDDSGDDDITPGGGLVGKVVVGLGEMVVGGVVGQSKKKSSSPPLPETFGGADWSHDMKLDPNPMRWGTTPLQQRQHQQKVNFIQGMHTLLGSGDPTCKSGIGIYVYAFNSSMSGNDDSCDVEDLHMYNSDGDFLIVPQQEYLWIQTEIGRLTVAPGEICVIPRGIVFTVNRLNEEDNDVDDDGSFARGYMLEIFRGHFQLPELGPIGSNGLANSRDFLHPTAYYESEDSRAVNPCTIVNKFGQKLFQRSNPHSPYNVVAWHGNYLPYKYDLRRFCALNSVTYDHPDPSIYTVLTAKGDENGTALADFVIFPPRVMATDSNTFRPPWFHRNVMTEFMGLIHGTYDAKKGKSESGGGFVPGGASLHSIMTPHGPDTDAYYANVKNPCNESVKFDGGLAFMFESSAMCKVSRYALQCEQREVDYASCWDGLDRAVMN